jgi:hypothetical protein
MDSAPAHLLRRLNKAASAGVSFFHSISQCATAHRPLPDPGRGLLLLVKQSAAAQLGW